MTFLLAKNYISNFKLKDLEKLVNHDYKKDFIYLGFILIGVISHFVVLSEARHQSEWCDTFFEEFRKGL